MLKFRGKDETGKIRIGEGYIKGKLPYRSEVMDYINENDTWYPVYPDTVQQFVGYDGEGNELYEGDMVEDNYGKSYMVELSSGLECYNGYIIGEEIGDTLFGYRK